MTKKDLYAILGISKKASAEEIKASYRKLALKYHPDRNPDNKEAEEKFKEAAYAYEILSDEQKRQQYDQFGHDGLQHGGMGHGGAGMNMDDIFESFGDIFGAMFGGGGQKRKTAKAGPVAQRGHDLAKDIEISLKESFVGTKKEVSYYHFISCETCHASGAKAGTKAERCATCKGHGQVQYQQGFFVYSQNCSSCGGRGFTIPSPCSACGGQSRIQKYEKFSITIPAGVFDGAELRVTKKGDAGVYGGANGDLFVKVKVVADKKFKRVGNDIVCTLSLTYAQLVLGCQIEMETIDGSKETVKVPKGCAVGEKIIIAGKGFADPRSNSRGNLVVITECQIPRKISTDAKDLLMQYDKLTETEAQSNSSIMGFFKKFLG